MLNYELKSKSTLILLLLFALLLLPLSSFAQWKATAGAQRPDCLVGGDADDKLAAGCQAFQAMAFIPNEIWIHQNDSITWTRGTDEGHTVTFLYQPQPPTLGVGPYPAAQQRQSNAVGCSAYGSAISPDNSAYDPSGALGLQCVHSGTIADYGDTYTVSFPAQGNFKFTCLIHASMYGTVHVLGSSATLPYTQAQYDKLAQMQLGNITTGLGIPAVQVKGTPRVYTVGKIVATGGGWQYGSGFRFFDDDGNVLTEKKPLQISVGQTVEFVNIDPAEPHTFTFGCPTDDAGCPVNSGPGTFVSNNDNGATPSGTIADGGRFATLNAPFHPADERDRSHGVNGQINSGLLAAAAQDRATGIVPLSGRPGTSVPIAQVSPALNTFRVTFNSAGKYRFLCMLHDELGMIGWVDVKDKDKDKDKDK
jgi:plastocyanin